MTGRGTAGALGSIARRTATWMAASMRLGAMAGVAFTYLVFLPVQPTIADDTAFRDGHADRQAWETWFGDLSGAYRDGAAFWASHRSEPNPPDCTSSDADFHGGCEQAKEKLDKSDRRRHAEPDYRLGWNSPLDVKAATASPPIVLAQGTSNDAVTVTFTRVARFITPVNPFVEFFTSSAGGSCEYYATVDNHTPYHIIDISFGALSSITDMRAMSHDTDVRPMGSAKISAPMLRPDQNGSVHSGSYNYKVAGTVDGSFPNCEASVRDFFSNFARYTFVTRCTMEGATEGQCLSFVHVYVDKDFINLAATVDDGNTWINTSNDRLVDIDR